MKLLFCPACEDVLKLIETRRTCRCGASYGYYHEDGLNATIGGKAVPIGFDNGSFLVAYFGRPIEGRKGSRFTAFVIPHYCEHIHEEEKPDLRP